MKRLLEKGILQFLYGTLTVLCTVCLLMLVCDFTSYAKSSGECGTNLTWELENDVLKISGTGSMDHYEEGNMAPWYEYREQITKIEIGSEVLGIGDLAFYQCSVVKSISLPNGITHLGSLAFAGCTGLEYVNLGTGLTAIGDYAFEGCVSLKTVQFPNSLNKIGYHAFYRCSSLTSVTIPANISQLGIGAFAYCESLTQVKMECLLKSVPSWLFYGCTSLTSISLPASVKEIGSNAFTGCDNLETVYHEGNADAREEFSDQIKEEVETAPNVFEGDSSDIVSSDVSIEDNNTDSEIYKETIEEENSAVHIEVEHTENEETEEYHVTVDIIVDSESDWNKVIGSSENYLDYPENMSNDTTNVEPVLMNVYLKEESSLPSTVLESLAGKKVDLTIITNDGDEWVINCETINVENVSGDYDLRYTIIPNDNPTEAQTALIGNAESYLVEFVDDYPFEVEVKIRLGIQYARQYATIYHKPKKSDWSLLQSVVIEDYGYAPFYLSGIQKNIEYMVALNVQGIDYNEIIIPESMSDEYGGLTDENGTRYVVTGAKSSWGINIGQLTWIIVGVIAVSVLVVGVIMGTYAKAKRKQKAYKRIKK